jgi:tRNA-splicing ligase RtcB
MIFGQHDANTLKQFYDVASRAVKAALMGDGHLGYVMPIGGVAAYDNQVSVVGVGFDIACGNAAICTDLTLDQLTGISVEEARANPHRVATNPLLNELADTIQQTISFGIGRKNLADDAPVDDPLFLDPAWYLLPNTGPAQSFRDELMDKARKQLGTVGSGNHYVDVFYDETGRIWVGVHFGSRGLGHTIASGFLAISQGGTWGDRAKEAEVLLDIREGAGYDYWNLMELAGRYAYTGREWVARKVVQLLGGHEADLVHNHHNFAWKEKHPIPVSKGASMQPPLENYEEREVVVVRKGATPAFPGQRGFVGGSMGDDAVILRGTTTPNANALDDLQTAALFSTVHGAGRVMSRTEAAGKRDRKTGQLKRNRETGEIVNAGRISPQMLEGWLKRKGVILRGGGLDEAPQAYRRLPEVLTAQGETVEVLHTLTPAIVVMAGANEWDPYKD